MTRAHTKTKTTETKGLSVSKKGTQKNKTPKTGSPGSQRTLYDLFETGLKDIYSAEKQLLGVMPEIAKASYSEELRDAFSSHNEESEYHVERLEKIMDRFGIDPKEEEKCEAMKGLVKEVKQMIKDFEEGPVRDAALIIAVQKAEHYEIASYGSLRELSLVLGYDKTADLLESILEEEEEADKLLSSIALDVNEEACEVSEESALA